jgi:hypothetical protein
VCVDGDADEPLSDDKCCRRLDDRNEEDNRAADPKAEGVRAEQSPSQIPLPVADDQSG